MSLYSNGIIFKFRFQKSRFTHKNRKWADTFSSHCSYDIQREREVVEVWCSQHRSAPIFDDLSLFEYHSYIKMETAIGISGKSGI